jgi:AbiV family abortive infection protein
MTDVSEDWWESVEAATAVGQRLGASSEEFNAACEHIVQLLTDASMLLEVGSHATAAFLAITALEETAKVRIGSSGARPNRLRAARILSTGTPRSTNSGWGQWLRWEAAIGEERMHELMAQGQAGDLVKIREAALYVAQGPGGLVTPSSAVSPQTSRELMLLAIEAFDDGLVGYTSRSMELGRVTDALFARWAA